MQDGAGAVVAFEHVTKRYGGPESQPVVNDLTFTVPAGEICVLVGPSGSGKTTTMKMVNRLIEPSGGRITVGGRDVQDLPAVELRRRIGYVIQQVGLFPHLTVGENVAVTPVSEETPELPASGVTALTAGVRRVSLGTRTTASTRHDAAQSPSRPTRRIVGRTRETRRTAPAAPPARRV